MSELNAIFAAWDADGATLPRPPRRLPPRAITALTVLCLFALWWALTAFAVVPKLFLPAPADVLAALLAVAGEGFVDATLWQHASISVARVGAALLLAVATAVPLGVLIGSSRRAGAVFDPLIEFYRPIPPLAYLPLIVIWCGIGEVSKVLLIYLAIFAPLAIATVQGVRRVEQSRVRAAQALGATRAQLVRFVILPSAAPDILTGIRIGIGVGVGWSTLVAAELIAAERGLGFMIQSAAQFLVTDVVVMGIFVIAVIAFAFDWLLRRLQKACVPWAGLA
ncbi:ABC transporter permease subunit [Janthinobacterium sp.]|uniref:ABC transporter permease subunit n=1 Tax=Janthinobacterium sp. TaxID=1871054 RepID=UPI00293D59A7|nr:ABC transporter permease subunit [Janthinobacterium sp.]